MHGKDAVVEEILDWRPYDYVTDRTILDTPAGPLKFMHTIEFEPTASGTTVHMRYALPTSRRNRDLAQQVAQAYGAALQSSVPNLCSQLDAEHDVRMENRDDEPRMEILLEDGSLPNLKPIEMSD
jgi:hypothetical protein